MGAIVIAGLLIVIPFSMRRKVVKPMEAVLKVTTEISKGRPDPHSHNTVKGRDGPTCKLHRGHAERACRVNTSGQGFSEKVKLSESGFVTGMNKLTEGVGKRKLLTQPRPPLRP